MSRSLPLLLMLWMVTLLQAAGLLADERGPTSVELLAAGDMRGEIKPCGCSPEGQFGGLPRRLTFLEQAVGKPSFPYGPILVDLGNNFPDPSDQGRLKIDLIQFLLKKYPPDAVLAGPQELTIGVASMDRSLPYVLSNDSLGVHFRSFVTVLRGPARMGVYGFLSPGEVYQQFSESYLLAPMGEDWLSSVRARIASEHHRPAILLFRGSDEELSQAVASGLFEQIVAGNPSGDESVQVVTRTAGGTEIPQVPTKGQGMLRIDVALDGKRTGSSPRLAWLGDGIGDHPVAVHAFGIYDDKVKGLFFARLDAAKDSTAESPYAGAQVCAACHVKASQVWNGSRHSRALSTLEKVRKNFDPECLACHVVGLDRQGFLSAELTPHLANVQCENCHGPGKAHAADPARIKPAGMHRASAEQGVSEAVCRTCHHGSHSPKFDYSLYWPRIAHGKE